MKFKIGDRVKVTRKTCFARDVFIGDEGKIVIGSEMDLYGVKFDKKRELYHDLNGEVPDGHVYFCWGHQLELVEEKSDVFKKDDIKPGYLVQLRNGEISIVTVVQGDETPELVLVSYIDKWLYLNDFNNDLTIDDKPDLDVVKIYGYSKYAYNSLKFITDYRPLLWERKAKESEPKRLTASEIEKELGYKIEIVSEDSINE